ncbi:MAG: methionyl-tRNA formyltransferase [Chloroflexi bacterium]|nr:methionyl-tRNA formyltransferase [Chloroflexota bacterium]
MADRFRIVFMGTPPFAVPTLDRLVADGYDVVAVYTQPDRPTGRGRQVGVSAVKARALELGLAVVQPERLRAAAEVERLRAYQPGAVVVAAYGLILPPAVLAIPPHRCLNVHASLLPRWRGAAPVAAAILAGDAETGVTIMLMEPGIDTGPMLSQRAVPIDATDTTRTLTARLAAVGAALLGETLPRWLAGTIQPAPQDERAATMAPQLTRAGAEIDWTQPAIAIARRVRAFDPWPGTHTHWNGRLVKILAAQPTPVDAGWPPGTVPGRSAQEPSGLLVQTGSGSLAVTRLQLEGKRPATADEFLRGYREVVGVRWGPPKQP